MRRAHTGGPIVAGLAFAVAWLPCTGPDARGDPHRRLGRGHRGPGRRAPGLLLARAGGAVHPERARLLDASRACSASSATTTRVITVVSGLVLIVMGVLLYTNELTRLNSEALSPDGRPRDQLLQRALTGARTAPASAAAAAHSTATSSSAQRRPTSSASSPTVGGPVTKPT